jgi:NtrC-family two-component system response regulator AlgB
MIDMRILVIDDEAHIRKTTAVTLDALGHECAQAANSAEALGHLQKGSFDAAFLDLRLGDESGLELIPKMLALEPKLNVIVFTAYTSIDTAVEAMRRGAVDYIAKPFTPEQIRQSLSRIENNRRLENRVVELESMLSDQRSPDRFQHRGAADAENVRDRDQSGRLRRHHPPAGRKRHGQKRAGPRPAQATARAATTPSSPWPARAFRASCSKASSSATCAAPSPARSAKPGARSRPRKGGTLFLDEIGELPTRNPAEAAAPFAGAGI